MSFAKRIVIDTSTLIGALLKPQSVPRQAFNRALATATVCVSPATLAELESVLLRDKFDRYLDRESRLIFLQHYHAGNRAISGHNRGRKRPNTAMPRSA